MKGFVFTADALFATIVSITIALSFYLVLEGVESMPAGTHTEREVLAALDRTGGLGAITESGLAGLLSPYNKCGTLSIKTGGALKREVVACPCISEEIYSGARSFVSVSGGSVEYSIATLRTCTKG